MRPYRAQWIAMHTARKHIFMKTVVAFLNTRINVILLELVSNELRVYNLKISYIFLFFLMDKF